jgi:hypothetical protein
MAANNRIFYACQAVALKPMAGLNAQYKVAHGVQSVGITTNFNLEQAFELGQIQIYENIEGLPDVEVTMEKLLDGYPLLYHLASQKAESAGLVGRSKPRADVALGIYSDGQDSINDNQTKPSTTVFMSGMYINSISYTVPVDGNATESITMVGNHKEWISFPDATPASDLKTFSTTQTTVTGQAFGANNAGGATDSPLSLAGGSGGVQRRENVMLDRSIMPLSLLGNLHGVINAGSSQAYSDTGNVYDNTNKVPLVHLQNFSVSTDFGREDILELGRKAPYHRPANFPIEVTTEIEAIAVSGDFIGAYETGDPDLFNTNASGDSTAEEGILLTLRGGIMFDCGFNNRLSSVSYGGGDATGGNATISYSYTNFNELTVCHSGDPALASKGGTLNYSEDQSGVLKLAG